MMPQKTMKVDVLLLSILGTVAVGSLSLGVSFQHAIATPKPSTAKPKMTAPAPVTPKQTSSIAHPVLRMGAVGKDVKDLQNALKKAGFYQGPIDGGFGAQTQAAVMKFQQAKKMTAEDGVVGPQTWALL